MGWRDSDKAGRRHFDGAGGGGMTNHKHKLFPPPKHVPTPYKLPYIRPYDCIYAHVYTL